MLCGHKPTHEPPRSTANSTAKRAENPFAAPLSNAPHRAEPRKLGHDPHCTGQATLISGSLELARLSSDLGLVTTTEMMEADDEWMMKSLYYAYGVVESHMNERDTKTGRRNQTLYTLALCEGEQFRAQEVEELVRKEFPVSTEGTTLNIPQIMSQLTSGDKPLIRRSPKGDAFFFKDPRHRMVLRAMLIKTTDGRVEKRPISRGQTDA